VSVVLLLPAEVHKELNDVDKAVIDNGTRLRCPCKIVTFSGERSRLRASLMIQSYPISATSVRVSIIDLAVSLLARRPLIMLVTIAEVPIAFIKLSMKRSLRTSSGLFTDMVRVCSNMVKCWSKAIILNFFLNFICAIRIDNDYPAAGLSMEH
jgi:hypothetical protein